MRTIVIIGGIILAGATTIAIMMDNRNESAQPAVTTQGVPAIPSQGSGVSPMINPAHGQPGHRCDLAVGAPLTDASATQTPAAIPQNIQGVPAPAGLKTNPPHGQPGHRCDLQVGAPL